MRRVFLCLSITSAVLILLSGCMKMGPDYRRPDTGIQIPGAYQHACGTSPAPHPEERWWQIFGDPKLDRLVEDVLRHNLDIKKATARILEARYMFVETRADRFPSLNLQGQAMRQRRPEAVSMPGFSIDRESETYNLSLPASFELDLWGRLARAEEAARANLLQAEENRRTVSQTIVAEAITLYLRQESLERRIQIARRSIENYRRSLALIENRYEGGIASILELKQARRILAQAEAFLPSLRQEMGIIQQKLSVLLGRYPNTRPARAQPDGYFKRLASVPAGLPSELLLRRPDLRAAEARLMALNAQIGVIRASRFPRITLTGSFGYSSEELDQLFRPQSELWNLALGITQPLFDAGKLKAGQRAAEARYQEGVADYARTVLTAFSEVEISLLTRREQLERRDRVVDFLRESRGTLKVAEDHYKRGLVDYLTVLESQQTLFKAEEYLVLVELTILSNRVSLHRALGGGWGES